jgi:hypothetical protein
MLSRFEMGPTFTEGASTGADLGGYKSIKISSSVKGGLV